MRLLNLKKAKKVQSADNIKFNADGWQQNDSQKHRDSCSPVYLSSTLATTAADAPTATEAAEQKESAKSKWLRFTSCKNETSEEKKSEPQPISFFGLFRFASKKDRRLVYLGIFIALFVGAVQPLSMYFNGKIADILINNGAQKNTESTHFLRDGFTFVLISGAIGFGLIAFSFAQYFFLRLTCLEITNVLRVKFLESVLRQDAGFFDVNKAGALNTQLNSDIERISDGIGDKIGVLVRGIASFVSAIILAFIVNWKIALSICAVGPVCALIMSSIAKVMGFATRRSLRATEAAGAVLQEALINVRTVQACNGESTMVQKFAVRLAAGRLWAILQYVLNGVFDGFFFLALYIFNAIGAYYGATRVVAAEASGGDVLITTNLMLLGAYYLGAMSPYIASIFKARIAAANIYAQIDRVPESVDAYSPCGAQLRASNCVLEFRDVSFAYKLADGQTRQVLRGISWSAKPGESVALVGYSGCGKSTCISLITRFYECDMGAVTVNDMDVKRINLHALRSSIGIVAQEPVLFNGTVFENVALGDRRATLEMVEKACRLANAHEFIGKLENGYFTQIGTGHVRFSGGQKQRLAIARALVNNPPILLLDEATSALDAESEVLVQNALESASRGRTTIIIAHRLSTLRNVDKIVVIDEGKVVETGTHEDLSKAEGIYAKFVQSQSFNNASHLKANYDDEKEEEEEEEEEEVEEDEKNDEKETSTSVINAEWRSTDDTDDLMKEDSLTPSDRTGGVSTAETDLADLKQHQKQQQQRSDGVERKNEGAKKKSKRVLVKSGVRNENTRSGWFKANMWKVYSTATGNYGKLALAIILSSLRGLELIMFVRIMSLMFVSYEDYKAHADLTVFYAQQFDVLYANITIGIYTLIMLFLAHSFCGWTAENVVDKLKICAFRNVLTQDGAFFDRPRCSSAALVRRITSDAYALKALLDYRLYNFMNNASAVIMLIVFAFLFAWRIALIGCIILFLLSILPTYLNLQMQKRMAKSVEAEDPSKLAVEIVENVRTIQLLTRERYFCQKYQEKLLLLRRSFIVTAMFDALIFAFVQSFLFISDAFCFGAGILVIYYSLNTSSDVFIASASLGSASFAVLFVSTSISDMLGAKSSADSIFELIEAKFKVAEGQLTLVENGNVELCDVDFAYPTRPQHKVSTRLSLSVKRGECVALVGPSGGGKSTIVSLLQRYYEPTGGAIKVDDLNIELFALSALRNQVALVEQEPVLFSGTIFDNVRLGVENLTSIEDVIEACELANAKSFIETLPSGYLTDVGEKSSKLSGGQKQRIAIARALIRKPKILLLDEATSALDAQSEMAVQQALTAAQCDRACITIAHRLSSIQHADRIYFFRNGRVIESGTYAELISNTRSAFAQMVQKQQLQ